MFLLLSFVCMSLRSSIQL